MQTMLTRRALGGVFTEAALAQRGLVPGELPAEMVWLNANENPAGPPACSLRAIAEVLPAAGRYHFQGFRAFHETVARSEGLDRSQVVVGTGSTEVLNFAVAQFTGPERPFITMHPSFEGPAEMARALGRPVVNVPLTAGYAADVRRMAAEAAKAGGGLLYLCNPNNPTGAVTPAADVAWLADHLPPDTVALVDEAYIHYAETPQMVSALEHVRRGKDVIVARTFSKIYGMAGLRVGFGCARPEIAGRMAAMRNAVISVVGVRAVMAALAERASILEERRAALLRTRKALYEWLRERRVPYIESHANFVMIDAGRPAREIGPAMARMGVAPGRPFPPLEHFLRVTIGTDAEMQRFREVFWKAYKT